MTDEKKKAGAQPGILTLNIPDKHALYNAYMPFISNGGLFIATSPAEQKQYHLDEEVFVLLNLVEQGERMPVAGKVVWITPPGSQGQRVQGIGIQFSPQDNGVTQRKLETILAGMLESPRATHTM